MSLLYFSKRFLKFPGYTSYTAGIEELRHVNACRTKHTASRTSSVTSHSQSFASLPASNGQQVALDNVCFIVHVYHLAHLADFVVALATPYLMLYVDYYYYIKGSSQKHAGGIVGTSSGGAAITTTSFCPWTTIRSIFSLGFNDLPIALYRRDALSSSPVFNHLRIEHYTCYSKAPLFVSKSCDQLDLFC